VNFQPIVILQFLCITGFMRTTIVAYSTTHYPRWIWK